MFEMTAIQWVLVSLGGVAVLLLGVCVFFLSAAVFEINALRGVLTLLAQKSDAQAAQLAQIEEQLKTIKGEVRSFHLQYVAEHHPDTDLPEL
jgi:hypothetical protein